MGMIKSAVKWILIAFVVLIVLGVLGALLGGSDYQTTTEQTKSTTDTNTAAQPANTATQPESTEKSAETAKIYAIGDRVTVGEIAYTVTNVEKDTVVGDEYFYTEADGIFMIIDLTIENLGKETKTIDSSLMKAIDSQGREFDPDSEASIHLENNLFLKQAQPGLPTKGQVAFDLPMGETFNLQARGGFWSGETQLIAIGST